jgi:Sec-independent protein translocase protein TatA
MLLFSPNKLPGLGRGLRQGLRNFNKSLKGEEDIDVTDSIKRLDSEDDSQK